MHSRQFSNSVLRGAKIARMEPAEEPNVKRSAAKIRREMRERGAIFFEFSVPEGSAAWHKAWLAVEKFGFFVTKHGCLLPYKYYRRTNAKAAKQKGHQRAAHFFFGREPKQEECVNDFGWPCDEQISHLCHHPDCLNPLHLSIEARWRNLKRNYCGFNGTCDCGVTPPCLRTYIPSQCAREDDILSDTQQIKNVLQPLHAAYPFKYLQATHYDKCDQKAENRLKRLKRTKKTEKQARRKKAKADSKAEAADDAEVSDGE
jgi:hypothetical protein